LKSMRVNVVSSGTYEKDVEEGNGREWLNVYVDAGSMMTVCQVQLIWRKMLLYVQCVDLMKYLTVEHEHFLNNA